MAKKKAEKKAKKRPKKKPQPALAELAETSAESRLVNIPVSPELATFLCELGTLLPKGLPDVVEEIVSYYLEASLVGWIDPEQLALAKTFEERGELAIALLRALRGEPGYEAAYVVRVSEEIVAM